ncbi:hypothetical protein [Kibale red colobus virus 2]|uniref:Uncharacterized protein n=1 Tax=Kibale red colobus virus 2 TaxID=1936072 RepID=X2D5J8_9NIDO|nr:hypothetical protein [Kibale red colobus virus 2]AHH54253.1 hypothetical protein [Kibale red colobus virus 2]
MLKELGEFADKWFINLCYVYLLIVSLYLAWAIMRRQQHQRDAFLNSQRIHLSAVGNDC